MIRAFAGLSRVSLSRETYGLLLGFLAVIMFGGTLPFTKLTIGFLDPWFVSMGRAAVAGLLSCCVVGVLKRPVPFKHIKLIAFASLTACGGFASLIGLGLQTVPASHGGIILGIIPFGTAFISSLVTGERPSRLFWIASLFGTGMVVGFSTLTAPHASSGFFEIGDLYLLLAAFCASSSYVALGFLSRFMPGWEAICWCCIVALPFTIPIALLTAPTDFSLVPSQAWIGFAYASFISMFLGFFAWNAGLAMGGIARVSQTQLLQIFVTLGLSIPINGEYVSPASWIVAGLVMLAVIVSRKAHIQNTSTR